MSKKKRLAKKERDTAYFASLGFLPVQVAFAPTEKAWKRVLKLAGFKPRYHPYPGQQDACCTRVWRGKRDQKRSDMIIIITVGAHCDGLNVHSINAMLGHESLHAVRATMKYIQEKKPSAEFEAYLLQQILGTMMYAYRETRMGILGKKNERVLGRINE